MRALALAIVLTGCWRGAVPEPAPVVRPVPVAKPRVVILPPGERVGVDAPPDVDAPPAGARLSPKGVHYKVLYRGKGSRRPTGTDIVKVHYTGWTTDGALIDSSVKRGTPAQFALNAVIAGWTDGLQRVTVGDTVRLWIPEDLAYKGSPGRPQGMLVFEIELLEIVDRP
jgi:hypothetical protein